MRGKAAAEKEEEKVKEERINLEKQIKEDEKIRLRAIRIAEREDKSKMTAEERILAENKGHAKGKRRRQEEG